ncbi:MAG: 2-hydroxyacyl-CoA dehydratase, partial [Thermodesulfobacteriota bacterium]|nr:2-hydroxyacyl-CoA dehydratase [Thermodesulfobacteriota bacterium]
LAKEWNVEGAIVVQQKFCDPHELDIPALREYFEDNGVPTYFLELDVTVPVGQFSTRVEAFIESLMLDIV